MARFTKVKAIKVNFTKTTGRVDEGHPEVWSRLVDLADEFGGIDWSQLIADGTFCPAKKGEHWSPTATREKGRRLSC
jgi:hypothetical protein